MSLRRTHRGDQRRDRGADERGSAAVELVVVFPVVLLLLFAGMQGALLYQAKATALAAAQDGARTAAGEGRTVDQGYAAARSFLAASSLGQKSSDVNGNRTPTEATFVVTVTSQTVIPLWSPTVTQSASMPVERITG
ncbi:hypothetical protein GCM10009718_27900 [Isoptericola halotolerans]|uniref:Flp pilus assembly protein TadG n=1 Tax=Isoptericola halotolerans TaxID=300560 RepID=A0ABX2A3C0_9MICO|nr:Flp pilus assembly protein TadG [Isoptericola halotolerans]